LSSKTEYARLEREGPVAIVTMTRDRNLNALGVDLVGDVVSALGEAEADTSIRAAVLAGEGRAFSSGGDLADVGARVADGEVEPRVEVMRALHQLILRLRDSRLPVVAAVHGSVYGAGFSTALACDLVVASRETRFCQIFVRRNLVPDLGSPWLLPRAVGMQRAKELMLLGEPITAEEAERIGAVNRVVDGPEQARAEAIALAARIAESSAAATELTKSIVNRSEGLSLEDSLRLEGLAQALALGTPDTLQAMRDFLEKKAQPATER
jgi:2-(1,2-epoxy-1,2-dihydrophenyl)acetyl-CoA isomerase